MFILDQILKNLNMSLSMLSYFFLTCKLQVLDLLEFVKIALGYPERDELLVFENVLQISTYG